MQQIQFQNFRMMPLVCDKVTHQGEAIRGLCLTPMCNEKSSICFKCYDTHRQCQIILKDLEEVPIKLLELQQLQYTIVILQGKINEQFKELLSTIEQILSPLAKFQDVPNLTNLNGIGSLLKGNPQINILNALDQTKMQFLSLFGNLFGNFEQDAEFWSEQGYELNKQKKYNEAIYCLDKAIQLNPNDDNYWSYKGYALYMLDQFIKATNCFGMAILLNPKDSNLQYSKGEALLMQNKVEEACACYNKAIQLNPQDANMLLEITLSLFILSKFKEANDCYNTALQLNSQVSLLLSLKVFPLCTKARSKAEYLQEFKKNVEEWHQRGLALFTQSQYKEAIDCFDKAIELDPKHHDSFQLKGRILYYQDKFKEAIDCLNKAIELDPKHHDSRYLQGLALQNESKYKEAIDCLDMAIELDPEHLDSRYLKGLTLFIQSKYIKTIQCCDEALKYHPNDSNLQCLLQQAKDSLKQRQKNR